MTGIIEAIVFLAIAGVILYVIVWIFVVVIAGIVGICSEVADGLSPWLSKIPRNESIEVAIAGFVLVALLLGSFFLTGLKQ